MSGSSPSVAAAVVVLRFSFSFVFILIVFWLIVGVYWVNIIKLVYIRNIKMRLSLLTKKKLSETD